MLASPYYRITSSNAVRGIALWILMCGCVFCILDGIATRSVPIQIEDFRTPDTNDEQVLSLALQLAFNVEYNYWWIHNKRPYLVFDTTRTYNLTPDVYTAYDLYLTKDASANPIAIFGSHAAGLRIP
jgi:hypothetical protein